MWISVLFFRPTFRRILRNKSTEQFSGLPYIYSLLNCLICLWYGSPFISQRNLMLVTVNSVGATFQLCYIILFIMHTDKKNKVSWLILYLILLMKLAFKIVLIKISVTADEDACFASCGVCCGRADCSWKFADTWQARTMVLCWVLELRFTCLNVCISFVCYCKYTQTSTKYFSCVQLSWLPDMYGVLQNLVIRTKSVEFMPFYLSLSTFLLSGSFLLYGLFNNDAFVYVSCTRISKCHCNLCCLS